MGLFIHLSSLRPLHHKRPSKLIWYKYNVCQTIQSVLWWNNCPIKWITLHLGSGSWQIPGGTFKNRKKTQTLKWLRTVLHFPFLLLLLLFFKKFLPEKPALIYLPTLASPTRWPWVWAISRSWWWTGKPSMLQSIELQRVRYDWVIELNSTEKKS